MKKLIALTPAAAAIIAAQPSRKMTKFINDAIEHIETTAAQATTIARLTKALQEIDETLSGSLPVTRKVKQIARKALEQK
uniref:Uncharacterized protein n=1 Tax=viral metagenome TaxID=1070528 RepID=A0A6M3LND1_9ZZZZ